MMSEIVFEEVSGLYRIIPLRVLRRTPGVAFDVLPRAAVPKAAAIDRVLHEPGAVSPGPVGQVARPWYMHPHQEDNLMVLHGTRLVDVYTQAHGRVESFLVAPHRVEHDGRLLFDGPATLAWPTHVFHRIVSDAQTGSASVNFATRSGEFNIRTNFNVYDLDPATGEYRVIREGHLDQPQ